MNTAHIDAIAKAVLYEGYMLYPYRPSSVKNRQRFNFGVLYPRAYSEAQSGSDAWRMQTECLIEGDSNSTVEVKLRFLKLVTRTVREPNSAASPWQEAIECEVAVPVSDLDGLALIPLHWKFSFPAKEETEPLHDAGGQLAGPTVRRQESIEGVVEVKAERLSAGLFRVQVLVKNLTSLPETAAEPARDPALVRSLVSAHILLGVLNGQFVSLLEPPDDLRDLAASCQNIGVWPVLVGGEGQRDTMLASPIVLYDYPQIAPESPGDLFDGTEIDEILALRIMTMTDEEKQEMRQTDERARKMLERTETLPMEQLMKLHGTLRELRPSFGSTSFSSTPFRSLNFEPSRFEPPKEEMP
jgi:hydrogenase maturation protease